MPPSVVADLYDTFISKTWYEWLDLAIQFMLVELPVFLAQCVLRIFTSLAVTTSS